MNVVGAHSQQIFHPNYWVAVKKERKSINLGGIQAPQQSQGLWKRIQRVDPLSIRPVLRGTTYDRKF